MIYLEVRLKTTETEIETLVEILERLATCAPSEDLGVRVELTHGIEALSPLARDRLEALQGRLGFRLRLISEGEWRRPFGWPNAPGG